MTGARHGGDLSPLVAEGDRDAWLDLSTGINPHAYPAALDAVDLRALPQADALAALHSAARAAYRVPPSAGLVAAPGTQIVISLLPFVLAASGRVGRVAMVGPTYEEHALAWSRVAPVDMVPDLESLSGASVGVIVNPNNPDGRTVSAAALARVAKQLADRGGVLVVDEAFGDVAPELSVAGAYGTIVLKSFGKFYGLGGLRVGFAVCSTDLAARIEDALGPWAVSGPALAIARDALADEDWRARMRRTLARERAALDALLHRHGFDVVGGTDLYRFAHHPAAAHVRDHLLRSKIAVRAFADPAYLRFGLPGAKLSRLADALAAFTGR